MDFLKIILLGMIFSGTVLGGVCHQLIGIDYGIWGSAFGLLAGILGIILSSWNSMLNSHFELLLIPYLIAVSTPR